MPRKYVDYSKTFVYQLTCKNPEISDSYISYTTNITQRKYKHKRETLDISNHKSKLYDCIRKNGGWTNWKCKILEECSCSNEFLAKERANFYILKINPNLNDEKMDEKCLNQDSRVHKDSEFKPNIFADKMDESKSAERLDAKGLISSTNEGKYVCLCKKSYAHRSSYYKHTSTCLQFQHNQATNKTGSIDSSMNPTLSVSIVSTTTTTTTTT